MSKTPFIPTLQKDPTREEKVKINLVANTEAKAATAKAFKAQTERLEKQGPKKDRTIDPRKTTNTKGGRRKTKKRKSRRRRRVKTRRRRRRRL
jgi:hypothetical protein